MSTLLRFAGNVVDISTLPAECSGTTLLPDEPVHVAGCTGCSGVYECQCCLRICGWCNGAADKDVELCDDCANKRRIVR